MGSIGEMDERKAANDPDSSPASDNAVADAAVFPVIVRRFERVPDLDDRLRSSYALLSLPPFPLE
jgi:hypothetical protein